MPLMVCRGVANMLNHKLISMLLGLGLLGACSEGDERNRDAQNDNGADVSMSIDGGNKGGANVSIDLPNVKGKFSLPKIKLDTGDVDIDGVKLYPGSRVTSVDIAGEEGMSEGSLGIRFDADASPASVRDYFLNALKEKGVTASAQGDRITGNTRDGKPFSISLTQQGDVTHGLLKLGS